MSPHNMWLVFSDSKQIATLYCHFHSSSKIWVRIFFNDLPSPIATVSKIVLWLYPIYLIIPDRNPFSGMALQHWCEPMQYIFHFDSNDLKNGAQSKTHRFKQALFSKLQNFSARLFENQLLTERLFLVYDHKCEGTSVARSFPRQTIFYSTSAK